nr:hypothetical protein [Acinetobacter sp. Marseille-Q1620]
MVKIILGILLSVFIVVSTVMILYWRDVKHDPTASDFWIYLGLLPFGISLVFLVPYLVRKWYVHYKESKKNQEKKSDEVQDSHQNEGKQDVEYIRLNVFNSSLKSAFGENDGIFSKLLEQPGAELDQELVNAYGLSILSHRIADIEELDGETDYTLQTRIEILLEQQLSQNIDILVAIAEHLKRSAMFYDSQLAYEYRMHPAWIDPDAATDDEDVSVTAEQVLRLNFINVHIVLADTLLHVWDEFSSDTLVGEFLDKLGILRQQVKIEYHYWGEEIAYREWFNVLKQINDQTEQVSLILVADSEIHQETLDDRSWITEKYVPAEFVGSCCISSPVVDIEYLEKNKVIDIAFNENNLTNTLKHLNLYELPEYELENPFVILADDMTQSKVVKQVAANFESSPIEQHHYLYSRNSLGNTQHLSKIYGFLLGLHIPEDKYGLVYSTTLPYTQVLINPYFHADEPTTDL